MESPILITGVGKRIGFALAKYLVEAGYKVIGSYRTEYSAVAELDQLGVDLYQCDLVSDEQILAMIDSIKGKYPYLRAIIHNASDCIADDEVEDPNTIDRMMKVNVSAPYQINLALADRLKGYDQQVSCDRESEGDVGAADIIHLTDFVAKKGCDSHVAYAASKAALHNMTLSFAARLAPQVKVNSIAPALIMFNEDDSETHKRKMLAKNLLPVEASQTEIMELVNYLLGSRYVTGRCFNVDGGRHLKSYQTG
ncbi:dihydromonapterin reductase [Shewanella gelidii]|uniref:Dihydromonapterin reductase n=1 Tax=Shewanella gelidii TaxID=1642821 RepID=A0A917JPY4_9GAMM|nr:dihydromonapterin reductase [Shewanella gelidii]MCL1097892.1 dihydromonapterin reductase [Shewanella gelidii]GGI77918.1 dihydromonapterin reductase [Shewanella gelidii]